MKKISLFKYKNNYISNIDIIRILEKIRVFDCKILYIHSEINFGIPNPDLKKDKILKNPPTKWGDFFILIVFKI